MNASGTCTGTVREHMWAGARARAVESHLCGAPRVRDLLGDEVEEGVAALERQERLRLLEPHPRAQPAVELEHHGLAQERGVLRLERLVGRQAGHWRDIRLGNHQVRARRQLLVVVLEGRDGSVIETFLLALGLESRPVLVARRALGEDGTHENVCDDSDEGGERLDGAARLRQ